MKTTDKTISGKFGSGLFNDIESAEQAYHVALQHGYTPNDINVIMSEETRKKYFNSDLVKIEKGDKSMEGLAIGGAVGGAVGGTIGAIAAIGTSLVFPGLGIIVAGPLVAGLVGVGAGSISGGLLGALIGLGIPEEVAKVYEKGLQSGGIVIGVDKTKSRDFDKLQTEWKKHQKDTILS